MSYTCEHCGATHTCEAGTNSDGMCALCQSPMRIEEFFSDRRIVTIPVQVNRRDEPDAQAA